MISVLHWGLEFMHCLEQMAQEKSEELLHQFGLYTVRNKKMKTYSGGMRQRAGIAQALLNDPKILVVDEPTAGLDPKERVRFRHIIEQLEKDRIIILSTHIVPDVEKLCDDVIIMKEGRKMHYGTEHENLEALYLQFFEEK